MLDPNEISIVHWYSSKEGHKCGYCKNERGSVSYGMWAETLTVRDYQDLIDRGWRRSGKYCYKPVMDETCCPLYTIKCDVLKFNLSKSQKKVVKKVNKFCGDGLLNTDKNMEVHHDFEANSHEIFYREGPQSKTDLSLVKNLVETTKVVNKVIIESDVTKRLDLTTPGPSVEKPDKKSASVVKKGEGLDQTKPPCKKAKLLRLERKQEKLLKRGMSLEKLDVRKQEPKSLEQFLNEIPEKSKHKLKIRLVATSKPSDEWQNSKETEFELYKKYQMKIHNDPPEKNTPRGFCRFLVDSPLKVKKLSKYYLLFYFGTEQEKNSYSVTLERMHRKHKLFKVTYELFKKYQMIIHDESENENDENQYFSFLIDTPLQSEDINDSELSYGSYHQQYWLDDKLIAVGVIDILPKCVSSVYFFYDPDYRNLTLGTYGCLREIQFTKDLHEKIPSINSYYMGYYIHSCPKMRYKGKLSPSFLLCPETYTWCPIEKCIPKLDVNKYSRLADDLDAIDLDSCSEDDVNMIKIIVGYRVMYFRQFKRKYGKEAVFDVIGRFIGKKCTKTLLFALGD